MTNPKKDPLRPLFIIAHGLGGVLAKQVGLTRYLEMRFSLLTFKSHL